MRLLAALLVVALAACSAPQMRGRYDSLRVPVANPSKVIAAELAFARMAREKGTWTAFRHYATDDALMPSPDFVRVQEALKGVSDPAAPIVWGPEKVWSSCDGSFAVSTGGAEYPSGRRGRFLTIWQRQSDGEYRWVLDQGFDDTGAQVSPEMISANVAECNTRAPESLKVRRNEAWGSAASNDGSLEWSTLMATDCSRIVTIRMRNAEGTMEEVFRREAPAPNVPEGSPAPGCKA
ncbi:MAG: hypothetical protein R3E14_05405 [Erythrobacter sp.]